MKKNTLLLIDRTPKNDLQLHNVYTQQYKNLVLTCKKLAINSATELGVTLQIKEATNQEDAISFLHKHAKKTSSRCIYITYDSAKVEAIPRIDITKVSINSPGSYAFNHVLIEQLLHNNCDNQHQRGATNLPQDIAPESRNNELPDDIFYQKYSPIPARTPDTLYQKDVYKIAILVDLKTINNNQALRKTINDIAICLRKTADFRQAVILTRNHKDDLHLKGLLQSIRDSKLFDSIENYQFRQDNYADFYALISKFDLSISINDNLGLDSIACGTPCFILGENQPQLAQPLNSLLEDKVPDINSAEEQLQFIRNYFSHGPQTIISEQTTLHNIIYKCLDSRDLHLEGDIEAGSSLFESNQKIISAPDIGKDTLSISIKKNISKNRRKMTKLSENPERFFKDSNNRLIRGLYFGKKNL